MFKRFIGALICAVIYVVPVHAEEITIGFPGPLTGPLGFLGDHMKWAASLAVDEICAVAPEPVAVIAHVEIVRGPFGGLRHQSDHLLSSITSWVEIGRGLFGGLRHPGAGRLVNEVDPGRIPCPCGD